ncbi:MAG: M56 family metallopeptidase [Planctomycetota bacterium]
MNDWFLTYLLHSTVLGLAGLGLSLCTRSTRFGLAPASRAVLLRAALLGPMVTASIATVAHTGRTLQWSTAPTAAPIALSATSRTSSIWELERGQPGPATEAAVTAPGQHAAQASAAVTDGSHAPEHPLALALAGLPWLLATLSACALGALVTRELRARRRLAGRTPVRDAALLARAASLANGARVKVSESAALTSPVALGRDEVVLPTGALARLAPGEREALIAHEVAHLARRDPLWLGLARTSAALTVFQPLQRVLLRRLEDETELAADAWAAARTRRPLDLARCLEHVGAWLTAGSGRGPNFGRDAALTCTSVAMARRGSSLVQRVEQLCAFDVDRASPRTGVVTACVAAAIVLAGCSGPAIHKQRPQQRSAGLDGAAAFAHFESALSKGVDDLLDPSLTTHVVVAKLTSAGCTADFTPRAWDNHDPELWIDTTVEGGQVVLRSFGQQLRDVEAVGDFLRRLYARNQDVRIRLTTAAKVGADTLQSLVTTSVLAGFTDISLIDAGGRPTPHPFPDSAARMGSAGEATAVASLSPSIAPFEVTPYTGPDAEPGERRFKLTYLPGSGLARLPKEGFIDSSAILDVLRREMRQGKIPGTDLAGRLDRLVIEAPADSPFLYAQAWFENAAAPDLHIWKTEVALAGDPTITSVFLPTDTGAIHPEELAEEGTEEGAGAATQPSEPASDRVEVRIDRDGDSARYTIGPRRFASMERAAAAARAIATNDPSIQTFVIDARSGALFGDVVPLVRELRGAGKPVTFVGSYSPLSRERRLGLEVSDRGDQR